MFMCLCAIESGDKAMLDELYQNICSCEGDFGPDNVKYIFQICYTRSITDSTSGFVFDRIDRRTKRVTPALIAAVRQKIVESIQPRQVVLFGSQARGKVRQDSDIDLLICLDDDHPLACLPQGDRAAEILDLFRYRSFGLDVIV
jgi:predicted nucleotidyltransferase